MNASLRLNRSVAYSLTDGPVASNVPLAKPASNSSLGVRPKGPSDTGIRQLESVAVLPYGPAETHRAIIKDDGRAFSWQNDHVITGNRYTRGRVEILLPGWREDAVAVDTVPQLFE